MTEEETPKSGFRDRIVTINDDGRRKWIYPERPKGTIYNYRMAVSYFLLLILFATPFLKMNGEPFLLLNFPDRFFILFGVHFWPQDIDILFLIVLALTVFVVLFTLVYGRIWCGWTCPQTIFMEFVFRQIEYLIEGSPAKQKKLKADVISFEKIWKKSLKHILFFLISLFIGNMLLSYIIGVDELQKIISEPISMHAGGFTAMMVFTSLFYVIYSMVREHVCIYFCPYGRLQSVLIDTNSIIVAYDYKRGEPRGPIKNTENGDCIDCKSCVNVCPTGIDVRNGSQLECINCTACIDACNHVMTRIKKPKGLIRFSSEKGIEEGSKFSFSPKLMGYTAVLIVLLSLIIYLFATRSDIEATVFRTPGTVYMENNDGSISNLYSFKILNKSINPEKLTFNLIQVDGEIIPVGESIFEVPPGEIYEGRFFVKINTKSKGVSNIPLDLELKTSDGILMDQIKLNFFNKN